MEAGQKWIKLQSSGKLVYLVIQSILWYLRFVRKQKILIPFGNQDFTVFFFFKVVPPEIEPFASAYSNSLSDCTFITLSFMKAIELASH